MQHKVTLDSVISGRTTAFEGSLRKLKTDINSALDAIAKRGGFSKDDYNFLCNMQDSLISAFDSAGSLNSLLLVRDYTNPPDES